MNNLLNTIPVSLSAVMKLHWAHASYNDNDSVTIALWIDKNLHPHGIFFEASGSLAYSQRYQHPSINDGTIPPLSLIHQTGLVKDFKNKQFASITTKIIKTFTDPSIIGKNGVLCGPNSDEVVLFLWEHFKQAKEYYITNITL